MHCSFPGTYCCTIAAVFSSRNSQVFVKDIIIITAEGNRKRDKTICTTKEVFGITGADASSRMFWTTALVPTGQAYPHHLCFATKVTNQPFHWRERVVPGINYPGNFAAQSIEFSCFDTCHTAILVLLCHLNMPRGWAFQPPQDV